MRMLGYMYCIAQLALPTGAIAGTIPESTSVFRPKEWVFPCMSRNRVYEIFKELIIEFMIYPLYDMKIRLNVKYKRITL